MKFANTGRLIILILIGISFYSVAVAAPADTDKPPTRGSGRK